MANSATLTLHKAAGEALRFDAVAGSGQATVVDSGPGMIAPSPIEALLIALAGCTAMDVISILRKKRERVTGYSVTISGDRRAEHPKAYTQIALMHRFRGHELNPEAIAHAIDLSHSKYCSVQGCLDPSIPVTNQFEITPELA